MREIIFTVKSNKKLAQNIFRMTLDGNTSEIKNPGQFVNVKLYDKYLRRPFSVCDWSENELTIIYKVVGSGTELMRKFLSGEKLSALTGLGNGYDLSATSQNPVLVGGGVGVPPLYGLAKKLLAKNIIPSVILGFNRSDECFYVNEFQKLGLDVKITTLDGSAGIKGFVTDALTGDEYVYACGPLPMLKAVYEKVHDGQFSFESRMGCGFGACMGCSMRTRDGFKRICKDGPILKHSEILWSVE